VGEINRHKANDSFYHKYHYTRWSEDLNVLYRAHIFPRWWYVVFLLFWGWQWFEEGEAVVLEIGTKEAVITFGHKSNWSLTVGNYSACHGKGSYWYYDIQLMLAYLSCKTQSERLYWMICSIQ
jgi:hypothetical protein